MNLSEWLRAFCKAGHAFQPATIKSVKIIHVELSQDCIRLFFFVHRPEVRHVIIIVAWSKPHLSTQECDVLPDTQAINVKKEQ